MAVLVREIAPDRDRWLVLLTALTPLVYLPAWPIAALAAVRRRWLLTAAAAGLVGLHAAWVLPVVAAGRGPVAHPAVTVRILTVNLNAGIATGAATQRLIDREHPDVLVLSEASPVSTAGLRLDAYAGLVRDVSATTHGWVVASRWPIAPVRTTDLLDRTAPRVTLLLPDDRRLVVWQVHPIAPVPGDLGLWRQQLSVIRTAVAPDLHGPDPTILAGDFNATRDLPGFAALLDDGWTDALDGRGLLPTWQAGHLLPPVLRLDHVLVSRGLGIARVHRADVGSDHLAVLVDVQLPR